MSGADLLGDLINYGSRPGEWQPSGGDHVPHGWVGDGTHDHNDDHIYVGMPDLTSFCVLYAARSDQMSAACRMWSESLTAASCVYMIGYVPALCADGPA